MDHQKIYRLQISSQKNINIRGALKSSWEYLGIVKRRSGKETHTVMHRILIVGIGNLLLGDDGFGPEVISALEKENLSEKIELRDMGITGITTATELEDFDYAIFIDAMETGGKPGTLKIIKIDVDEITPEDALALSRFSIHELSLEAILKFSKAIGTLPDEVYLLGCQPERLDVKHGLSPRIREAVPMAVKEIIDLIQTKLS